MHFLLQIKSMIDNIGYPDYVLNTAKLDEEFDGVRYDHAYHCLQFCWGIQT